MMIKKKIEKIERCKVCDFCGRIIKKGELRGLLSTHNEVTIVRGQDVCCVCMKKIIRNRTKEIITPEEKIKNFKLKSNDKELIEAFGIDNLEDQTSTSAYRLQNQKEPSAVDSLLEEVPDSEPKLKLPNKSSIIKTQKENPLFEKVENIIDNFDESNNDNSEDLF